MISALVFWKWYTLDGEEWHAKKEALANIHLQKERAYIKRLQEEGKISKVYEKLYGDSQEEA